MADKIRVKVLHQKVFHDGLSMVVLKPGSGKVDPKHLKSLFDEGVIADPGKDALRRAAALSGFTDAGETTGPGDDSFSQPIGAFTEEQERNLAEQSQALAGDDDDDDLEALCDRIAELEQENDELRKQLAGAQPFASIRGEVVEGGAPLSLGTKIDAFRAGTLIGADGAPIDPPAGDISDPPSELDLTDEQRAHLPQLDHDGDGRPGGSTVQTGDDLPALREEYEALAGKRVFHGWDADTLRAKIGELRGDAGSADDADAEDVGDEDDAPPA